MSAAAFAGLAAARGTRADDFLSRADASGKLAVGGGMIGADLPARAAGRLKTRDERANRAAVLAARAACVLTRSGPP